MKKIFVFAICAALLAGCAFPGPVVYYPVQTEPTCPYGGVWVYNKNTQHSECVIRVTHFPAGMYYPGPPVYREGVGVVVVVFIKSGHYRYW